jgi:MerR family redox-sensitive transcriptional activator SoxR
MFKSSLIFEKRGIAMTESLLTIGEVAERSGLAASAVRFYEKQGLVRAQRTAGNQRLFRRDVLRKLAFIRVAQKVGLTLDEIVTALNELPHDKAPNAAEWRKLSRGWRQRIDERIEILEALRGGLTDCIGCGCLSLRTCALANRNDQAAQFGSGPQYLGGF